MGNAAASGIPCHSKAGRNIQIIVYRWLAIIQFLTEDRDTPAHDPALAQRLLDAFAPSLPSSHLAHSLRPPLVPTQHPARHARNPRPCL